jgi:membrane protease YdiL (CAAX protease family)
MIEMKEERSTRKVNDREGMLESLQAIGLFITPILLVLPFILLRIIDLDLVYYIIYTVYILGTITILKFNNKKLQDIGISTKGLGESLGGSLLFVSILVIIITVREGMQVTTELTLLKIVEQVVYNFLFSGPGQEILFRGLMLFSIWRWKGWKVALVITSVLFGLVHITKGINFVLATMIYGFVYGYIVYQSKNIIGPTVAHGLYNFLLGFLLV